MGEPRLPLDLERTIFEIAAHQHQNSIHVFMQVARRVCAWLEPILYKAIILQEGEGRDFLPADLFPRIPSSSQGRHVQRLLFIYHTQGESPKTCWENHIGDYPNLLWLAIWGRATPPTALSDITSLISSPLRTVSPHGLLRFSGNISELFPDGEVDFHHIVFQDLTHLDVVDAIKKGGASDSEYIFKWKQGNNLGCLKKLRNLAFSGSVPSVEVIVKCLEECESLELMIIFGWSRRRGMETETREKLPRLRRTRDGEEVPEDRVINFAGPVHMDEWISDWHREVTGDSGHVWVEAERIKQERR